MSNFSACARTPLRITAKRFAFSQSNRRWNRNIASSSSSSKASSQVVSSSSSSSTPKSTPWLSSRAVLFAIAIGAVGYVAGNYNITSPRVMRKDTNTFSSPNYASMAEMIIAIDEIRATISQDTISTDKEDLKHHGYSEWSPSNIENLPVAVAYPKSTEEVAQIAKICYKYRIPMIGYSGGSSLEGNFSAPYGGISIDFMHMDKVLKFNEEDMDIVLQPAVSWVELNKNIADRGLFFPVDPSPTAKFGGMVGTNCSGTNAVRYGTMKDWVINLTVVIADGTIIKTRNRPRKSAAGYNLNGVFVGSEGTLGLVTEMTVKLAVIPKEFSVAVVTFPTIRDAAASASAIMRSGVPVAALELLDAFTMGVVNKGGHTAPKVWKELPTLFIKFSGTKASVADNIIEAQNIAKSHKAATFEFAKDQKEQDLLWSARKQALFTLLAFRPEGTSLWSTDVAVPFSKLADIIEQSQKEMEELGLFSSIVGHLGDGNFHEAIMYHKTDPVESVAVAKSVQNMIDRALEMDGTCTGEHSIGLFQKGNLLAELGQDTVNVMRSIKQSLDPNWLLNPGKIFDVPSK